MSAEEVVNECHEILNTLTKDQDGWKSGSPNLLDRLRSLADHTIAQQAILSSVRVDREELSAVKEELSAALGELARTASAWELAVQASKEDRREIARLVGMIHKRDTDLAEARGEAGIHKRNWELAVAASKEDRREIANLAAVAQTKDGYCARARESLRASNAEVKKAHEETAHEHELGETFRDQIEKARDAILEAGIEDIALDKGTFPLDRMIRDLVTRRGVADRVRLTFHADVPGDYDLSWTPETGLEVTMAPGSSRYRRTGTRGDLHDVTTVVCQTLRDNSWRATFRPLDSLDSNPTTKVTFYNEPDEPEVWGMLLSFDLGGKLTALVGVGPHQLEFVSSHEDKNEAAKDVAEQFIEGYRMAEQFRKVRLP